LETRLRADAQPFEIVNRKSAIENELVRLPGVAPGHAPWREAILLLNHNRGNQKGRKRHCTSGPCHFNKEQTPLGDLSDPNPRFHGGCFGV